MWCPWQAHHKSKCVRLFVVFWLSFWVLQNECSRLFQVWTTGLHAVLQSKPPVTQWGCVWIESTERKAWTQALSFLPWVQLSLLPVITSLAPFPGTNRPFFPGILRCLLQRYCLHWALLGDLVCSLCSFIFALRHSCIQIFWVLHYAVGEAHKDGKDD